MGLNMKFVKKSITLCAAALAVCMMFTSCSSAREETGVAYEKNMSIKSANDLEGKAVAVQLRSEADEYVVKNKLTDYPKRYEDLGKAAQDLVDKKIAAIVTDSKYAKRLCSEYDGIKTSGKGIGSVEYKFAALKEADGDKLIEGLNKGIAALKGDGIGGNKIDALVSSCIAGNGDVSVAPEEGKELSGTVKFTVDPYFEPFVYKKDDSVTGFFPTVARMLTYNYGSNYEVKQTNPGETLAGLKGEEKAFTVVSGDVDVEKYAVSDVFYTSQLVIVIRSSEK